MEINLYTRNDYIDRRSLTFAADHTELFAAKEQRQENYDTVTIHTDFSKGTSQTAVYGSEDSASAQKILSLRQQIATGAYQPDSRRIAECMLIRRSQPGLF